VNRRIQGTRITPDVVFPTEKIAVYVDGCFWHSCPQHATQPVHNREWWQEKLHANYERDKRHTEELQRQGWAVMRFWEHQDPDECAATVDNQVRAARKL
jgi:DNA mismatch endonuclease (patch repair protein)